jgi:hypothetical protein
MRALFGSSVSQDRCIAGSFAFAFTLACSATRATWPGSGAAAARLALTLLATLFLHRHFGRDAFDFRLWTGTVDRILGNDRRRSFYAAFTNWLFTWRLNDNDIVVIAAIHIVAITLITVAILILRTIVTLEALLHLRLGAGDNAVVVFCVLQIVFGNDTVARTLGIAGKLGVFFGDMLCGTANFDVRTRAVIGPGQRVATLAVEIVVIVISTTAVATAAAVITATPSTALVLLSWPHRSFT